RIEGNPQVAYLCPSLVGACAARAVSSGHDEASETFEQSAAQLARVVQPSSLLDRRGTVAADDLRHSHQTLEVTVGPQVLEPLRADVEHGTLPRPAPPSLSFET